MTNDSGSSPSPDTSRPPRGRSGLSRLRAWLGTQFVDVTHALRTAGRARLILAAAGALTVLYGGLLVLEQVLHDNPGPVGFLTWWAGGPLVVDLLAVPVVVVTAIGLGRVIPAAWRRAVESAALVNLLLVLVAAPFLSGLGRRPDNPSLLDRDYVLGFGVLIGLVWLVALVPPAVRALRARR